MAKKGRRRGLMYLLQVVEDALVAERACRDDHQPVYLGRWKEYYTSTDPDKFPTDQLTVVEHRKGRVVRRIQYRLERNWKRHFPRLPLPRLVEDSTFSGCCNGLLTVVFPRWDDEGILRQPHYWLSLPVVTTPLPAPTAVAHEILEGLRCPDEIPLPLKDREELRVIAAPGTTREEAKASLEWYWETWCRLP